MHLTVRLLNKAIHFTGNHPTTLTPENFPLLLQHISKSFGVAHAVDGPDKYGESFAKIAIRGYFWYQYPMISLAYSNPYHQRCLPIVYFSSNDWFALPCNPPLSNALMPYPISAIDLVRTNTLDDYSLSTAQALAYLMLMAHPTAQKLLDKALVVNFAEYSERESLSLERSRLEKLNCSIGNIPSDTPRWQQYFHWVTRIQQTGKSELSKAAQLSQNYLLEHKMLTGEHLEKFEETVEQAILGGNVEGVKQILSNTAYKAYQPSRSLKELMSQKEARLQIPKVNPDNCELSWSELIEEQRKALELAVSHPPSNSSTHSSQTR